MIDIERLLSHHKDRYIKIEDIPSLDLYMDQVTQLFDQTYHETKRDPEEKILTKTMINNYAKGDQFLPVKNKKYTKEHIMLIQFIYQLKGGLSLADVKQTLKPLVNVMKEDDVDVESLYQTYSDLMEMQSENFEQNIKKLHQEIDAETKEDDTDHLLLILSLIHYSNMYRKLAENLIDEKLTSADGQET
ncbi:protein of unknown function [Pelagirhabdus alkalitolerans]|uniref:DUF1836 domain-containing protein n=1 Tax=Pelagirhabdus alkalitolerans TaxID=1612202 RepID=A0A1G6GMZ8_9BACI|nr:DUF1836 domain-containing protein [Pelagirhabdus alkalitolerans]SDB82556.1 protein of unknown function [Pelagirhabdus alkalitolerans]